MTTQHLPGADVKPAATVHAMTTSAAPRSSAARERLLRTASALFYGEGVHTVGVDRVIAEAAVTRATFYRHFPSKESLVRAYLEGVDQATREAAGAVPDEADAARAWLAHLSGLVGEQLCTPSFRGCPFINAAAEYPDPASPVRATIREHRHWLEQAAAQALRVAGHHDPAGAARAWMVLRDGAMVGAYLGEAVDSRATLDAGVEALLSA